MAPSFLRKLDSAHPARHDSVSKQQINGLTCPQHVQGFRSITSFEDLIAMVGERFNDEGSNLIVILDDQNGLRAAFCGFGRCGLRCVNGLAGMWQVQPNRRALAWRGVDGEKTARLPHEPVNLA